MRITFLIFVLSIELLFAQSVPDYQSDQTYLYDPPLGMNVIYAHENYSGSRGDGIKIIDIESGWNLNHKDIDDNVDHYGTVGESDHGTAVMGIMVGEENGWGITGIVPNAKAYAVQGTANDISSALSTAIAKLTAGDVLLIEVQVEINYNGSNYFVPAEYYDYNRQKIKEAINKGITVIEVAGNSNFNLDLLDEFTTDENSYYFTGAIIVGASNASHTARWDHSNYGSRVDAHGIGENVVSTGYGDKYNAQGKDYYYTGDFGGTSASGPMIAGVVASLQGIYKAYFGSYISPQQMRNYIRYGGSWLTGIGSYPDMKKLIAKLNIPQNLTIHQKLKIDDLQEKEININIGHHLGDSWDNSNITPWNTTFYCEHDEILNANQETYTEDNVKYYKYHNWNNDLTDIKNYRSFHIDSKTDKLTAYFKEIKEVTIVGKDRYNNTTMGLVYIKDPWYIYADELDGVKRNKGMDADHFGGVSLMNITIVGDFKGVFLEQGWPGWSPPYYSVKAEAQQNFTAHGQNITGYFLGWEGTDVDFQHADKLETPVVFHAANAEARAVYKGHLASSVARATGYNNGRRLCKTVV